MEMEDVNKTVKTTLEATPAHATLDMLRVAFMDVLVRIIIIVALRYYHCTPHSAGVLPALNSEV